MEIPSQIETDLQKQVAACLENILVEGSKKKEWEFVLGRGTSHGYFGTIHRGLFTQAIRRLRALPGVTEQATTEQLDFRVSDRTLAKYRFTIEGREDIMQFCKGPIDPGRIKVIEKVPVPDIGKIDISDYGIRSNLKIEETLTEAIATTKQSIELPKTFRYKKRISFLTGNGFQYDLTVVKSSPLDLNGKQRAAQNLQEANLLNQPETYEIEVEFDIHRYLQYRLDTDELEAAIDIDPGEVLDTEEDVIAKIRDAKASGDQKFEQRLIDLMYDTCTPILQLQQNTLCVTPESKSKSIVDEYRTLLKSLIPTEEPPEGNMFKMFIDKTIENGDVPPCQKISPQAYSSPSNTLDFSHFVGPKPVSLEMEHVQELGDSHKISILEGYTVTDKADGEGNLLFINGEGDAYLIDPSMRVRNTGFQCKGCKNTILNGEYITRNQKGCLQFSFYAYDAYVYEAEDGVSILPVWLLPFVVNKQEAKSKKEPRYAPPKSRLEVLQDCVRRLKQYSKASPMCKRKLSVYAKHFYYAGCHLENPFAEEAEEAGAYTCSRESIFQLSKRCWSTYTEGRSPYTYDGLIYTPMHLPVGYMPPRGKKTPDWHILPGKTWAYNLKWKPPHENTIDFLVKLKREPIFRRGEVVIERDQVRTTSRRDLSTDIDSYKTLHLYVGGTTNTTSCNSKRSYQGGDYGKILFRPTFPSDPDAYIAPIRMKGADIYGEDDGNAITDGTIVEFSYRKDTSETDIFRWIPKRTRYDKTFEHQSALEAQRYIYQTLNKYKSTEDIRKLTSLSEWKFLKRDVTHERGYSLEQFNSSGSRQGALTPIRFLQILHNSVKGSSTKPAQLSLFMKRYFRRVFNGPEDIPVNIKYGNDGRVANNVWKTIQNPVTVAMITGEEEIPPSSVSGEVYYQSRRLLDRNKSDTIHLQRFHNAIKRHVLLEPAFREVVRNLGAQAEVRLLDIACGKGGDLPKWKSIAETIKETHTLRVVATDIATDNLENQNDGACVRYSKMQEAGGVVPTVAFFQADARKNIQAHILEDAMQTIPKDFQDLMTNKAPVFDVISLQFALHYFWESNHTLDELIDNIVRHLKPGGYFVGSCFDGQKLWDRLQGSHKIEMSHQGQILCRITRKYALETATFGDEDPNCVGHAVDVYMNSINKTHREYLVNFPYFCKRLREHNIVPDPNFRERSGMGYEGATGTLGFANIATSLSTSQSLFSERDVKFIKNTVAMMNKTECSEISYLNSAFVFKRTA